MACQGHVTIRRGPVTSPGSLPQTTAFTNTAGAALTSEWWAALIPDSPTDSSISYSITSQYSAFYTALGFSFHSLLCHTIVGIPLLPGKSVIVQVGFPGTNSDVLASSESVSPFWSAETAFLSVFDSLYVQMLMSFLLPLLLLFKFVTLCSDWVCLCSRAGI